MKKILVILPNNLGDVIMTLPVLEGLKTRYPGCLLSFFVENGFEAGIENSPWCDEIITFPRKEIRDVLSTPGWGSAASPLRSTISRIALERFDWIVNLCQHEYISYAVPLMKGTAVAGRYFRMEGNHAVDDFWSHYLYAIPFARSSNRLHASDVYRRIAGVKDHGGGNSIRLIDLEKSRAQELLEKKGVDFHEKIMVLQPGASYSSKCWPVGHFITLGRMLTERGWQILLTGAPQEAGCTRTIREGIGRHCFSIAGETNFRESIVACHFAHGCVTGDTAQMHAAAGLGVPVYALFGPTNPVETGPYGTGNMVLSAYCPDKPCFKTSCMVNRCMQGILPETVLSCIENRAPENNTGCDIYKTETERNGDFRLTPFSSDGHAYVSETNSRLTLKAFEPETGELIIGGDEKDFAWRETAQWLGTVERMRSLLDRYVLAQDGALIGEFERIKRSLADFKGVGEFWTALLNIRLNSVPLLHPIEGIRRSIDVCDTTLRHIKRAVS